MNIIMIEVRGGNFIRYNIINILDIEITDFDRYYIVNIDRQYPSNSNSQPTYPMCDFIQNPNLFNNGILFKMFDVDYIGTMNDDFFILTDEKQLKEFAYTNRAGGDANIMQAFFNRYNMDKRNEKMKELITWLK